MLTADQSLRTAEGDGAATRLWAPEWHPEGRLAETAVCEKKHQDPSLGKQTGRSQAYQGGDSSQCPRWSVETGPTLSCQWQCDSRQGSVALKGPGLTLCACKVARTLSRGRKWKASPELAVPHDTNGPDPRNLGL